MLGTCGNMRAHSKRWWLGVMALCVFASRANAQQLVVADVSTASFPLVTMQLFSFDRQGNPAPLDPQRDRLVTERMGVVRQTTAVVTCPPQWEPAPIAGVLALDWASELVRSQARTVLQVWEATAPPHSTLGAVIFGGRPYLASDFTASVDQIAEVLSRADQLEVAVPHRALTDSVLGAIPLAARSSQPWRCALVVTEHLFPPSSPPGLVELVRQTGVRLIVLTVGHRPPQWLRSLCAESGGIALGDVTAELLPLRVRQVLAIAAGYRPCTISWQSTYDCVGDRSCTFDAPSIGGSAAFGYRLPLEQLPMLDVVPRYRNVGSFPVGLTPPQEVVLTARNADLTLLAITADQSVQIVEGSLSGPLLLRKGESYRLRVQLQVSSGGRTVGALRIVSTSCSGVDAAVLAANTEQLSGSAVQFLTPATDPTIAYAGSFYRIEWVGALPSDSVTLRVQRVGDTLWQPLAEKLTVAAYQWFVPQKGRYRFELRDRTGRIQALSAAVQVIKPPLSLVSPDVQSARVGTALEFLPPQLLCSDTSQALRIDSVRFVSGKVFSLARGVPDELPPMQCITLWLRFSPNSSGHHTDTLEVYTPVGMQRVAVEGYAPAPTLTLPQTIWVGTMPLGTMRDTLVQWLTCATLPQQIRLIAKWPDTTQLRLLTIRQFTLTSETPCLAYPFGIRAERVGRTCLRLLVEGSERQPYECVIAGDVICAQPYSGAALSVPRSIVTQAGEVIALPVWMPSVPRSYRTMQRPFRFTVRCNASTLLPEPPLERGTIADGERQFTVSGRGFLIGDTLALLRFRTFWGDAPVVQLRIEDFHWLDDCSIGLDPVAATVFFTDYCTAGGTTRLFVAGQPPRIDRIEPQPSDGIMHVRIAVDREMPVQLQCYDLLGIERWRADLGTVRGWVEHMLALALPPGQYILQANSPFGVSRTLILLAR
jgi:hypothetical protein